MITLYSYPELFGVADNKRLRPEGVCLHAVSRRDISP